MGPTQGDSESRLRTVAKESLSLIDGLMHELEDHPETLTTDDHRHHEANQNERKSRIIINIPNDGFNRTPDGDSVSELIKNNLMSSLSTCGLDARVEAIHSNGFSSVMGRVRLRCFRLYETAVEKNICGGDANVKRVWYGASKNVIEDILRFGFGFQSCNGVVGKGIYLSAIDHAIESMQHAAADEDGVRHMLICRVILGNMEVISPFPGPNEPSSVEFDSGVDNKLYPRKYILWTTRMNTHILPLHVVSFRTTKHTGSSLRNLKPSNATNENWANAYKALSRFLNADAMNFVSNQYDKYKKHKISKQDLVRSLRGVVEDKLLVSLTKYPTKKGQNGDASSTIANSRHQKRSVPVSMTPITISTHVPHSSHQSQSSRCRIPIQKLGLNTPFIGPPFMQPSASSGLNPTLHHDSINKGKKHMFDF